MNTPIGHCWPLTYWACLVKLSYFSVFIVACLVLLSLLASTQVLPFSVLALSLPVREAGIPLAGLHGVSVLGLTVRAARTPTIAQLLFNGSMRKDAVDEVEEFRRSEKEQSTEFSSYIGISQPLGCTRRKPTLGLINSGIVHGSANRETLVSVTCSLSTAFQPGHLRSHPVRIVKPFRIASISVPDFRGRRGGTHPLSSTLNTHSPTTSNCRPLCFWRSWLYGFNRKRKLLSAFFKQIEPHYHNDPSRKDYAVISIPLEIVVHRSAYEAICKLPLIVDKLLIRLFTFTATTVGIAIALPKLINHFGGFKLAVIPPLIVLFLPFFVALLNR